MNVIIYNDENVGKRILLSMKTCLENVNDINIIFFLKKPDDYILNHYLYRSLKWQTNIIFLNKCTENVHINKTEKQNQKTPNYLDNNMEIVLTLPPNSYIEKNQLEKLKRDILIDAIQQKTKIVYKIKPKVKINISPLLEWFFVVLLFLIYPSKWCLKLTAETKNKNYSYQYSDGEKSKNIFYNEPINKMKTEKHSYIDIGYDFHKISKNIKMIRQISYGFIQTVKYIFFCACFFTFGKYGVMLLKEFFWFLFGYNMTLSKPYIALIIICYFIICAIILDFIDETLIYNENKSFFKSLILRVPYDFIIIKFMFTCLQRSIMKTQRKKYTVTADKKKEDLIYQEEGIHLCSTCFISPFTFCWGLLIILVVKYVIIPIWYICKNIIRFLKIIFACFPICSCLKSKSKSKSKHPITGEVLCTATYEIIKKKPKRNNGTWNLDRL